MSLSDSSHLWGPALAFVAYGVLTLLSHERPRLVDVGNILGAAFSVYGLAPVATRMWLAKASTDEWVKAIGLLALALIAGYPSWIVFQRLFQRLILRRKAKP